MDNYFVVIWTCLKNAGYQASITSTYGWRWLKWWTSSIYWLFDDIFLQVLLFIFNKTKQVVHLIIYVEKKRKEIFQWNEQVSHSSKIISTFIYLLFLFCVVHSYDSKNKLKVLQCHHLLFFGLFNKLKYFLSKAQVWRLHH